jgi:phosphoribosylamine-glycine ligase
VPSQRFYIWSIEGDGCALAWRLKQEGYDVVLRIDELWLRSNLDGIVEKTTRMPRLSDIVVFDGVGQGEEAARLAQSGYAVIGSSLLADELELDRAGAMKQFVELGIAIPETHECANVSEAIEVVQKQQGKWVFKPSGNQDCATTYVAKDELDMVEMLVHFQSTLGDDIECIMQRKLDGVCVSTEGWWNGEEWIDGAFNSTIEAKDLLVGNVGPKTGCEWCVVWPYEAMPELAMQLHAKIEGLLQTDTYIGPWDFNCIITPDGVPYLLEATPRFGYDAIEAYASLFNRPVGEMLVALVEQEPLWPIAYGEVGMSLRFNVKPYPFANEQFTASGDTAIRYRHEDESHLWFTGVRMQKRRLVSAPTYGLVGVAAAAGRPGDLWNLCDQVQNIVSRVAVPDLMYRTDPGSGVYDDWHRLHLLGYETPISRELSGGERLLPIASPEPVEYLQ